jgi:S-adenosylmethionine decarboxylase
MRTLPKDYQQAPPLPARISVSSAEREDHIIRRDGKVFAGTHLIVDLIGAEGLDCPDRIERAFRAAVAAAGATLLHLHTHKFSPQGLSSVAVLAESHLSAHTWPEIGYGAFDIFMCGGADPHAAVEALRAEYAPSELRVLEHLRGEGLFSASVAHWPAEDHFT